MIPAGNPMKTRDDVPVLSGGTKQKTGPRKWVEGKPVISIVTVVFNGVQSIERTIQSVVSLSYENTEYIIVDGGSTDGTIDVIKKYEDSIDYWISEKDKGIYDGMNKGIDLVSGEWINFMNCGDRFASAKALDIFNKSNYSEDIVYGDAIVEYDGFTRLFKKTPIDQMFKRMPFCHQASFTKSSLMKLWKFDLSYRLSSDYNFLYQAFLANKTFRYLNELICYFDFTGGASKKHLFQSVKERNKIVYRSGFNLTRWTYQMLSVLYIYISFPVKKVLGKKITNIFTRSLSRLK
jgi:glycosyltransferase involved in cell wall biosynthesis